MTFGQPERHTTTLGSPSGTAQCAAGCLRVYMDRRISRLERFLQRALPAHVFGDIRCYEGCAVRVGKDGLSFKYVVITGKSLLLADYPPRDVQEVVQLSDVTSIRVEHDFLNFLKRPQRDTCQHIRVGHRKHGLQDVSEDSCNSQKVAEPRSYEHTTASSSRATLTPKGHFQAPTPEPDVENTNARNSPDIVALLQRVGAARPHIPRSRSSLAQYSLQEQEQLTVARRAHSSLEQQRPRMVYADVTQNVREAEIHVYVLQGDSALLSHLQSCWWARLMSSTLELDSRQRGGLAGGRDVQHLETVYQRYKRELLEPNISPEHSFSLLQELHASLQRHADLKKYFWKDQMLYHFLIQRLQLFLLGSLDPQNTVYTRTEELEVAALTLDILLTTMQNSDCISDKIQMLQFNGGSVLKELLTLLLTPPNIPGSCRNFCSRMLEDFHKFGSSAWSNLPEAELIKLLAEVTNISTAILYELLLTLHKLIQNNSAMKLTKLLEGVAVECHVGRGVTQLLGLLFRSAAHKLKPLEAVLVYQHFFVLKCLMENVTRVQDYIQEQYEEEFRYYICWSQVNPKLPDNYAVKQLLRQLVEEVHRLACRRCADKYHSADKVHQLVYRQCTDNSEPSLFHQHRTPAQ